MATIVVLDDDPQCLARLHSLVDDCAPQGADYVILEASCLNDLLDILTSESHIDILISDIKMPEGSPSGIDIVQSLFPPSSGTQIIYTSADLSQATEVYRTNHLYFLLKPIDPIKLQDALRRAFVALPTQRPAMLSVTCDHKKRLISVSSIQYLESYLHKVLIHCGKRTFQTYARLDDLQKQLPPHFSRCHRSYLINLAYLSSYEGLEACLHDGTSIPVSRRQSRTLQHDLLAYLGSAGRQGSQ